MTEVLGGWRDKLIWECCHLEIHAALTALGWFNPLGTVADPIPPIEWSTERRADDDPIPPNLLVLVSEDLDGYDAELGSSATNDSIDMWLDFYPVDDSIGRMVMGDLRDLLRGKMPDVGFSEAGFMVTDRRPARMIDAPGAPGDDLFWIDIIGVKEMHDARVSATPEQRYARSIAFQLEDERP